MANALTLLHAALSEGIHELSEEACLERATDIRVILEDLAENVAAALKDEREIEDAVNRLTQPAKSIEKTGWRRPAHHSR